MIGQYRNKHHNSLDKFLKKDYYYVKTADINEFMDKKTAKCAYIYSIMAFFYINSCFCAFDFPPAGGRVLSMGHAATASGRSPETLFYNPAGVVRNSRTVFFFSCTQPYGLKELSSFIAAGTFKTRFGNLGCAVQHFGNTLYRENTLAAGSGFSFRNWLDWGILVRFLRLDISKYGSAGAVVFDTGIALRLGEKTAWGASVSNLGQTKIGKHSGTMPQKLRFGIGWKPANELLLSAEIDKERQYPIALKTGFEYNCLSVLWLRSGFEHNPSFCSFGFGLVWKAVSLDYGASFHPVLGVTHAVSIFLEP